MKIILSTIKQVKKKGTKTIWINKEVLCEDITETQYNNITSKDTISFFRSLGGSETATRGYTSRGYKVVRLVSTNPWKSERTIREFDFE